MMFLRLCLLAGLASLTLGAVVLSADSPEIDFARQIRPILSDHCFACHGFDEHERQADVRLDTAEGISEVINPDAWQESLVVERLRAEDPDMVMPPPEFHKPLSPQQKELLEEWVAQGAGFVDHWSFAVPQPADASSGTRDPIDVLLRRSLEAVGLSANDPADTTNLLRRVSLDLTGLPPTPEQIAGVLNGSSLDAYEKLNAYEKFVDQCLHSVAFGEHMGRYWLDLVRYGDTHGLHLDNYREMWPYRDWVIDAFNQNKSFDEFVLEQLAGDLLPDATQAQKIASGFNRLNVTTNEGGSIYDEVFARNVIDRTDAFGTIFLGLTTGCAVCHDHKFDPITQKDFYSLSAYFNSLDGRAMDGNSKDHAPVIQVASEEQSQQLTEIKAELTRLDREMKGPIEEVDIAQRTWEQELSTQTTATKDTVATLTPNEVTASGDTEVSITKKRSVLVGEKVAAQETLSITLGVPAGAWRMLELTALTDKANPRVGVSPNGNAVLSELVIQHRVQKSDAWSPTRIIKAKASVQQDDKGFAIEKAFDGKTDADLGWAVAGHEKTGPRTARFVIDPIEFETDGQLQITMHYQSKYAKHLLREVKFALHSSSEMLADEKIRLAETHVIGPFEIVNPSPGYRRQFAGEKGKKFDPAKPLTAGDRDYYWQHRGDVLPAIVNSLPYDPDKNTVAIVHQAIHSESDQTVDLLVGSDDGHVVILAGKQIGIQEGESGLDPLRRTYSLSLKKGVNHLFIKHVRHSGKAQLTYALRGSNVEVPESLAKRLSKPSADRPEAEAKSLQTFFRASYCEHPKWLAMQDMQKGLFSMRDKLNEEIPTTLVWKETAKPRIANLLKRGQYDDPGDPVQRGVPSFLPPLPESAPNDRLGLAKWLLDDSHPLTSRVAVNRFWQQLFGVGLVETSEDFGSQGTPPSHPKLLDQLAIDFRTSGWDVKAFMKRLVMTEAYRRDAKVTQSMLAVDPNNRFLARGPRYRLDAETLRDQMLAVSGLLVDKQGGPSVRPPQPKGLWAAVGYTNSNTANFVADEGEKVYRRSVYTFWKRTSAPAVMTTFDAPSRESCTARRERTNTPLQALLLLNEKQTLEASKALAEQVVAGAKAEPQSDPLTGLFERVVLRRPSAKEATQLKSLLTDLTNYYTNDLDQAHKLVGTSDPDVAAWMVVANTLLNLDEVVCK